MGLVGADLEEHEVTEVATTGLLELRKNLVLRAHDAQVDILRGSRALEAKLEHEATFQHRGITEHHGDTGEEAVKHEELPLARELGTVLCRGADPLLECLLERLGGEYVRIVILRALRTA
jgi:hypothetical protein